MAIRSTLLSLVLCQHGKTFLLAVLVVLGYGVPVLDAQTVHPAPSHGVLEGQAEQTVNSSAAEAITLALEGASLGFTHIRQELSENVVVEGSLLSSTTLSDSVRENIGFVSLNQDSGNLNNQANVRTVAVALPGASLLTSSVKVETIHENNVVRRSGAARSNEIVGSLTDTVGVVGVNQTAGNLNQMANIFSLGVGGGSSGVMKMDDAVLGGVSADNTVEGELGPRTDRIQDSFSGFLGVGQIVQSSGDLNILRNSLVVSIEGANLP